MKIIRLICVLLTALTVCRAAEIRITKELKIPVYFNGQQSGATTLLPGRVLTVKDTGDGKVIAILNETGDLTADLSGHRDSFESVAKESVDRPVNEETKAKELVVEAPAAAAKSAEPPAAAPAPKISKEEQTKALRQAVFKHWQRVRPAVLSPGFDQDGNLRIGHDFLIADAAAFEKLDWRAADGEKISAAEKKKYYAEVNRSRRQTVKAAAPAKYQIPPEEVTRLGREVFAGVLADAVAVFKKFGADFFAVSPEIQLTMMDELTRLPRWQSARGDYRVYRKYPIDTMTRSYGFLKGQPTSRDLANDEWWAWRKEIGKKIREDERAAFLAALAGAERTPYVKLAELKEEATGEEIKRRAEEYLSLPEPADEAGKEARLLAAMLATRNESRMNIEVSRQETRARLRFGRYLPSDRKNARFFYRDDEPFTEDDREAMVRALGELEKSVGDDDELRRRFYDTDYAPRFYRAFFGINEKPADNDEERLRLLIRSLGLLLAGEGADLFAAPFPVQVALLRVADFRDGVYGGDGVAIPLLPPGLMPLLKSKDYAGKIDVLLTSQYNSPEQTVNRREAEIVRLFLVGAKMLALGDAR